MRIIKSSKYVIAKYTGTLEKHYFKWTILNFVLYYNVALKIKKIKKKNKSKL